MSYLYLAIAIIAEVIATSSLKASTEFTKLWPSVAVILGCGTAFYFMTLALRQIPLGITYAIWSGLGIVLVTVVGAVVYNEKPDIPALIGMGLIIAGVLVINLFSKMSAH
jgi:small multidrug resistance pump